MPYANPHSDAAIASRRIRAKRTYYKLREKNIAKSAKWNRENRVRVNENSVARRGKLPAERVLFNNAKMRAKARGLPFALEVSDLIVPALCPVLGIPLVVNTGHAKDNSPSVDRVKPVLGYVKGNVVVMSHKANTMKSNATTAEMRLLLAFLEGFEK